MIKLHTVSYFTLGKEKKITIKVAKNVIGYFQKLPVHIVVDLADTVLV